MKYTVRIDGALHEAMVEMVDGATLRVTLEGQSHIVEIARAGDSPLYSLLINGGSHEVFAEPRPGGFVIGVGTELFEAAVRAGAHGAEGPRQSAAEHGGVTVASPMAGVVASVHVRAGEAVARGDVLMVIEAMKMNNEIRAPQPGMVARVMVTAGDRVEQRAPLVVLAPAAA